MEIMYKSRSCLREIIPRWLIMQKILKSLLIALNIKCENICFAPINNLRNRRKRFPGPLLNYLDPFKRPWTMNSRVQPGELITFVDLARIYVVKIKFELNMNEYDETYPRCLRSTHCLVNFLGLRYKSY